MVLVLLQHKNHGSCVVTTQDPCTCVVATQKPCPLCCYNKSTMAFVVKQHKHHGSYVATTYESLPLCFSSSRPMALALLKHKSHGSNHGSCAVTTHCAVVTQGPWLSCCDNTGNMAPVLLQHRNYGSFAVLRKDPWFLCCDKPSTILQPTVKPPNFTCCTPAAIKSLNLACRLP